MVVSELFFISDFLECQMLILLIGIIISCGVLFKKIRRDLFIFLFPVVVVFTSILFEQYNERIGINYYESWMFVFFDTLILLSLYLSNCLMNHKFNQKIFYSLFGIITVCIFGSFTLAYFDIFSFLPESLESLTIVSSTAFYLLVIKFVINNSNGK